MRLLFLTIAHITRVSERGIYSDLLREFRDHGHEVYVVCPRERRQGRPTEITEEDGVSCLRVRTGNLTKTGIFEKVISTALLEYQFVRAIERFLRHVRFDLVMYSTPPVTFARVIEHIKRRDGCRSYLLLKDILPQGAVDLQMLTPGSLAWRYLRAREKRLYALSDWIGCMSKGNVRYLLTHNPEVPADKVEVCPNSIEPIPRSQLSNDPRGRRSLLGIPDHAMVLLLGGNLGRPQGLGFLLAVLDHMKDRQDVYFLIIGSGTEYERIDSHLRTGQHQNARLVGELPKAQYDELLAECDVGLVFLDPRFTVPNFPSRLTSYMEYSKPIIAATDTSTDIRDMLMESSSGLWVRNGDLEAFASAVNRLAGDPSLRKWMGNNGRNYLEQHYTVARAYEIIAAHLEKPGKSAAVG